ncbi:MAG: pectate lyase, partial [Planctomycetales bacterium]|nr:pectate lyase [Planctomycetales bacterium]
MHRLPTCLAVTFVMLVLAGTSDAAPLAADADRPMNVLFLISDDLRNEMGTYGVARAHTPRLDALAERGVRFDRAYCQFPLCNPSRSSMLTGRRPTTTGVLGNRTWYGDAHPDFVSLPKYFRQHGYVTLRSGKIFHGGIDDEAAWTEGGESRRFGEGVAAAGSNAPPARRDGLTKAQRSDRWVVLEGDAAKRGDHRVADRAIDMLKRHAADDAPMFLACGFSKPHSPLEAPREFFDKFSLDAIELPIDFASRPTVPEGFPAGAIRPRNADLFIGRDASPEEARQMILAYLASSAWMDWNAGRVLDALDEAGLGERTIVVFWGDHGYQLGEKGKWSKAGSLWEQGARTPLVIYDPRAAGNGKACRRIVEAMDIFPTLVELCGLPPAAGVEGRSLATLLERPEARWDHPAYTVWSEDGQRVTGAVIRTEHWRYAEFYGRGAGAMLIDPEQDPHELRNLAAEPAMSEVASELSRQLRRYVRGDRQGGVRALRWREAIEQPAAWFASDEALRIAENLLLYQHPNGGWTKNIDMARTIEADQRDEVMRIRNESETMIDNGATHSQIAYLAKVHAARGEQRFADACLRGIEYLLEAQYPNGGWPMIYPHKRGYYEYITFNDGAMIGAMQILRDVARGQAPFEFAPQSLRDRAVDAIERGVDAILACQVKVDGKLTVWCAQHDHVDFQPRKARSYELP